MKRNYYSDEHIETSLINVTRSNMLDWYADYALYTSDVGRQTIAGEYREVRKQLARGTYDE